MPMPTTSPGDRAAGSMGSNVSSTTCGSPHRVPVAAARTYSQRGVMTATPNEASLGLTKWTRGTLDVGSVIATVWLLDALVVMRVGRRRGCRRRRYHFTLGDLTLRENGCRVIPRDFGTAATRELCGPECRDRHEFERSHEVRRTDHRAPAATPKKMAT